MWAFSVQIRERSNVSYRQIDRSVYFLKVRHKNLLRAEKKQYILDLTKKAKQVRK